MTKRIDQENKWHEVAHELEAERLKVMSYDRTILQQLGDIEGAWTLDFGAGPGVLSSALKRLGARSHAYDINPDMRRACVEKIGKEYVYERLDHIEDGRFDIITCNLVLCIVSDRELLRIVREIRRLLRKEGKALIGVCNPQIFDVPESKIDIRQPTGDPYRKRHSYEKTKKEGGYKIIEQHRPLEWYWESLHEAGLEHVALHTTPPYRMSSDSRAIRDFAIFEETRA